MATVRELLKEAAWLLESAGVQDFEREAAWLLSHVLGTTAGALRANAGGAVPEACEAQLRKLTARRAAREPIQYILGTEEFMGMTFRVSPAVLIPRLDTEVLVREAAALLPTGARVADIGTGSGAIALGTAQLVPGAFVVAVDLSEAALEVAAENARLNGMAERIEFRHGDLLQPLQGQQFHAILSNPPYIDEEDVAGLMPEVRDWEPKMALTPGADGLSIFRRLLANAPAHLLPGGFLGVEVGAGQAVAVRRLFHEAGYENVTVHCDTAGIERALIGRPT